MRFDLAARTLWLSVGDLLAEAAGPGGPSLTPVLRSRAALGKAVHAAHQAAQLAAEATYRAEVTLHHEFQVDGYTVHLQGRLDGLYDTKSGYLVEEVKSLLLPAEQFARVTLDHYPLYAQQLALYVYLLQRQSDRPVRGQLVLVNLADHQRRVLEMAPDLAACEAFVLQQVRRLIARHEARAARAAQRQQQAAALRFPFPALRPYQEAMMAQVEAALRQQQCLLLSAPTGIGKTAAALYPALVYALRHGLHLFFLTAKTTQQALAVATLQQLAQQGVPFTAVHLRAKEKSCLNTVYYCHESACEYARDDAAKLEGSGIVEALLQQPLVTPEACAEAGRRVQVCPFELSLEAALHADVLVGDYNYVFDPVSSLRRFFQEIPAEDCLLILDEAHNLYTRARDYYSPVLRQRQVRQLLAVCQSEAAPLFREFGAFFQELDSLLATLPAAGQAAGEDAMLVAPPLAPLAALRQRLEALMLDYAVYRRRHGVAPTGDAVQEFYYAFQRFCDVLALGGEEFVYLYRARPGDAELKILCRDAARFLRQRLEAFHSVVAMSATLTPFDFYRDVLGFPPERTCTAAFPSPFPRDNRAVLVIPEVSTAYRDRWRDAAKVARIIEDVVAQQPGNYLVCFPSFAYLRLVRPWLQLPPSRLVEQSEAMSEADRAELLRRLRAADAALVVLAVQGGIFTEGVDYPGGMLRGVILVGPGLPRVDAEQELIRAYYEEKYGRGFAYAYLYPGMTRVIQAAGRVIRSPSDVGVIVLLGKRFAQPPYATLLPPDWYDLSPRELITRDYRQALAHFWKKMGSEYIF
ncbi:MAG: ATP-dependent helicase [Candidatus Tectimicrobiota bacterium]|nr:MAG: ATP-dependent helicase [Candidatus Tectomicrobia bacterium]